MPSYRVFNRYRRDESGAPAIEYSLMAGILAAALVGILATGGATEALYNVLLAIVEALKPGGGGSGAGS